jgi:hypothetical protein
MAKNVYLKPTSGMVVRDPNDFNALPENGGFKELTTYWKRRLRDGSVVIVNAPTPAKKEEEKEVKYYKKSGGK